MSVEYDPKSGTWKDDDGSYVEYSANNSGGRWWLTDQNWLALEQAGWKVRWYRDDEDGIYKTGEDGRWLGALASHAERRGLTLGAAIREWEQVTGQNSSALGCSCCGTPHSFTRYNAQGEWADSYSPDYPAYGDDYYGD
jgi:hypothetical protein